MGHSTRKEVAQAGELFDILRGEITGAELVSVLPDGRRVAEVGASYEPTLEHPRGRLLFDLADRPHYSCPILGGRSEVAGHRCADAASGQAAGATVEALVQCRCVDPDTDESCGAAADSPDGFCRECRDRGCSRY